MNKNALYFKLLTIVMTIVILLGIYYIICKCNTKKEEFTPKIREMYRPYVRHARIVSEGFYGSSKNNITSLFRKFGLY